MAGSSVIVSNQASPTPRATKMPKTLTGGIGTRASAPNPTAVVRVV